MTLTIKLVMVLACNGASCHIILKSHHARQSYELDKTGFHRSLCTNFKSAFIVAYAQTLSMDYDLELELATLFLFATYHHVMIIFAKLLINPTMNDKVMGQK